MADYTATLLPGLTFTADAAAPVTAGDPVEVAGSGLVRRCLATGAPAYVGIAATTAPAGATLTVIAARPVFDGPADGPITAGDLVTASGTPGRQVAAVPAPAADLGAVYVQAAANAALNTALAAGRSIIGVALTTAADGFTVRWQQK